MPQARDYTAFSKYPEFSRVFLQLKRNNARNRKSVAFEFVYFDGSRHHYVNSSCICCVSIETFLQ